MTEGMADYQRAYAKACRDAVGVQNAVNLSGILRSWADAQAILRDIHGSNHSDAYLHDPVNILFASKISSLLRVSTNSCGGVEIWDAGGSKQDAFNAAYKHCTETGGAP